LNQHTSILDTRNASCHRIESGVAVEWYLNFTPAEPITTVQQSADFFRGIHDALAHDNARLLQERLFVSPDFEPELLGAREQAYGDLWDGVQPSVLVDYNRHNLTQISGVQIHAIQTEAPVEVIANHHAAVGRTVQIGAQRWFWLTGLTGAPDASRPKQARQMFESATDILNRHGATAHHIARTWLWLDDICDWYDSFNNTRSGFFKTQGLISPERGVSQLPASTGIGVANPRSTACSLDLLATSGIEKPFRLIEAGGHQQSAFNYGSAFSRAVVVNMPAGPRVYVSGTAAIDPAGITEHVNHIDHQIDSTVAHLRSILNELHCSDDGVLHAIVYCRNDEVMEAFRRDWSARLWPHVAIIADICRDDLLFEIEAVAVPG
jgi:enamine deaminase RidA (YjgF/YER057c/UK114 family)